MKFYELKYHLMPAKLGWLNDPNGLCQYKGIYHIFYQYCKEADGKGDKCWGHYTTRDFQCYKDEGIAINPDTEWDKSGAYSGCCLVEEDGMHIFYTGNVKLDGEHDYIHSGRLSNTIHIHSCDGIHFSEKEVVLDNTQYPQNLTCHIRDPKVFKREGEYYMVLGARNNKDEGCVLVYTSKDLKSWTYKDRISSNEPFGYMWECPDLITIDEDTFLICCPQGIKKQGILYSNENQNGYFKVEGNKAFDYQTLDYGYDFYAPQTFEDAQGRRILIAWIGLPDSVPTHPTLSHGWQHCLSLPREIKNVNHSLVQYPIQEILDLKFNTRLLTISNKKITFENKASQIHVECQNKEFSIQLNHLGLSYHNKYFSLIFKEDQTNREERSLYVDFIDELDVFLDTSLIEIFINKGEKTMSSRYYDDFENLNISSDEIIEIQYSEMKSFEVFYG